MLKISKLLNKLPNKRLTWDFTINGMETLDVLKPDGHARLFEEAAYQKNVMSQAVVVELKASGGPITKLDSRGNLFLPCVRFEYLICTAFNRPALAVLH
jgi:hypothetical protein